ncbi:MAG: hypothetical protein HGN29_15825 [Asgard group archaeon]|nr:hypothetical protein [Asgard group archaeon]
MKRNVKSKGYFVVLLYVLCCYNLLVNSASADYQDITITKIGEFTTGALYYHVDVKDEIVYFTEYDTKRFCSLDVQDPTRPISLANYSVTDGHDFEIQEDIAYLSTWEYGMEIVDISNPSNPTKISEYVSDSISHVKVVEDYIYASKHNTSDSFYEIIDISDPTQPEKVKEFCKGQGAKPFISGDFAYFGVRSLSQTQTHFRVYDISNPSNPELISEYNSSEEIYVYDIYVENDLAFYALANNGFMIIDFSDIANPVEVYTYENGNSIWRLHVEEDILIISNDIAGMKILDITNKTNPVEVASFYDGGSSYSFVLKDNLLFVADENDAIEILEISGWNPKRTSGFLLPIVIITIIITQMRKKKEKT